LLINYWYNFPIGNQGKQRKEVNLSCQTLHSIGPQITDSKITESDDRDETEGELAYQINNKLVSLVPMKTGARIFEREACGKYVWDFQPRFGQYKGKHENFVATPPPKRSLEKPTPQVTSQRKKGQLPGSDGAVVDEVLETLK
jgi:hypothetical protein